MSFMAWNFDSTAIFCPQRLTIKWCIDAFSIQCFAGFGNRFWVGLAGNCFFRCSFTIWKMLTKMKLIVHANYGSFMKWFNAELVTAWWLTLTRPIATFWHNIFTKICVVWRTQRRGEGKGHLNLLLVSDDN